MRETFRSRIGKFWDEFSKREFDIRKMMDDKTEKETLLNFVDNLLHIVFHRVNFELGINKDKKYELILTPEGDRVKLLQLNYWLQQAPKDLWQKWSFYSSKPARAGSASSINMFGINLSEKDISLYPQPNNNTNRVDIDVYCPKLMVLDKEKQHSMFTIFLDLFISEFYTMEYIGNIDFITEPDKRETVDISNLKDYIDSTITANNWTKFDNPGQIYTGYRMQPAVEDNWSLREDVFSGYSACIPILSAYYNRENDIFNEYNEEGIVFGFIFFENTDIESDSIVDFRGNIEDSISSNTGKTGIADSLGGATGFHFSYIDFIIYDIDAFLPIAQKVLAKYKFKEAGYSDFKSGANLIPFD